MGYDVNARFLDKLVRECFGQSEYVRPDENIEEPTSARLYNRIEAPVLTGVEIRFDFDQLRSRRGQPGQPRLSQGRRSTCSPASSWCWSGRYHKAGHGQGGGQRARSAPRKEKFDFPATLVEHSGDESLAFVEKLWAVRRVGEILDELDLKGKNEELVKELVELATRHGILTPYTSFMADDGHEPRTTWRPTRP